MDRRSFLKTGLAGVAAGMLPARVFAAPHEEKNEDIRLTILHTNDVHSRLDPFPDDDKKFAGKGGVAKRMTLIEEIRKKEQHVLLFDSGDIFQGTPYFNLFGGEPELKAMSAMQYHASTMGNHDFDNGLEGFLKVYPHAKFPFICSNYDFSNTILAGKTEKYRIFKVGQVKIGVIGLGIELKGLVPDKLYGNTVYLDPVTVADAYGKKLKEELGCHLVVCLSHLGYKYENGKISDVQLAQKTTYLDIILGGHTHTFLDAPVMEKNAVKKNVLINQAGWGGIRLGRLDLAFQKKHKRGEKYSEISYIAVGNQEIA